MDEIRETPAAARSVAFDAVPEKPVADPLERHGAEWGLASLLTGGMLSLGAVVFLVLAVTTRQMSAHFYLDHFAVGVIFTLHVLLTLAVIPINVLSVVAGLRGLLSARRRRQPVAFGLMGFFLSGLALGLWICACLAGFVVLLSS